MTLVAHRAVGGGNTSAMAVGEMNIHAKASADRVLTAGPSDAGIGMFNNSLGASLRPAEL